MRCILTVLSLVSVPFTALAAPSPAPAWHDVTAYGAVGDGQTLCTRAIQTAVDACHDEGGGTVYLPPGRFVTGTLHLRSRVRLYIEHGAVLQGSGNPEDYTPRGVLHTRDAASVSIEGGGVIDGNGRAFWATHKTSERTPENSWRWAAMWDRYRTHDVGHLVRFERCRDVSVKDIHLRDSPAWTVALADCEGVVIDGIRIRNPLWGLHTDGLDIVGSRNVRVSNCYISTGDDAICLKSEPPATKWVEDVVVTNCVLNSGTNGFKMGTGSHVGFRNITFSNSVIQTDESDVALRTISGISLESVDGGVLRDVNISNISIRGARTPFFLRLGNRREGREDAVPGSIHNVVMRNITARGGIMTPVIAGIPEAAIEEIHLADISIVLEGGGKAEWNTRAIPERRDAYPEAFMFGRLPASGLYVRHARNVSLTNYRVALEKADGRPALVLDDAADIVIDACRFAHPAAGGVPVIEARGVEALSLRHMEATAAPPLLQIGRGEVAEVRHHGLGGGAVAWAVHPDGSPAAIGQE